MAVEIGRRFSYLTRLLLSDAPGKWQLGFCVLVDISWFLGLRAGRLLDHYR
jgi:hypothetical protein